MLKNRLTCTTRHERLQEARPDLRRGIRDGILGEPYRFSGYWHAGDGRNEVAIADTSLNLSGEVRSAGRLRGKGRC